MSVFEQLHDRPRPAFRAVGMTVRVLTTGARGMVLRSQPRGDRLVLLGDAGVLDIDDDETVVPL